MLIIINILKLVIKPNEKQILFTSYSGRQFSDSPKEAYTSLKEDPAFDGYKMLWAFNQPNKYKGIPKSDKISSNSIIYFYYLLRSKYWVANSSIDRLVPFEHPNNIYIQFWHGIPMKTLGIDEHETHQLIRNWYENAEFDYFFTYGPFDTKIFKHVFPRTKHFMQVGQLRKRVTERRAKKVGYAC